MCKNRIVSSEEFTRMMNQKPFAQNVGEMQRVKRQLVDGIKAFYDDRWYLFNDATRKMFDYLAFLSAEKGFAFADCEHIESKYGVSKRTIKLRLKELIDAGLMVKVYRRNKRGNSLGNQIYLFTEHAYFQKWSMLLGVEKAVASVVCKDDCTDDCIHESDENPTASKVDDPKKVSTISLSTNIQNPLNKRNKTLSHEFVSDRVPKDFTAIVKPFFDDAKIIEEYWKMVEIDTRYLKKFDTIEIDFTGVAIASFRQMIRKHKLGLVKNPIAYFYGVFKRKVDVLLLEDIKEFVQTVS